MTKVRRDAEAPFDRSPADTVALPPNELEYQAPAKVESVPPAATQVEKPKVEAKPAAKPSTTLPKASTRQPRPKK